MSSLLLELFSEEVPSLMQEKAAELLKQAFLKNCDEHKLLYDNLEVFFTPRRIVLLVKKISLTQESIVVEKKGPRVGSDEKAILGFAKSVGLSKKDLKIQNTKKGDFYFSIIEVSNDLKEMLLTILNEILSSFSWPKSMRWGDKNIVWIRPLHNILCIFNSQVLPIEFGHLKANSVTYGHRFLSEGKIKIKDISDYKEKLRKAYVILDQSERELIIREQSLKISKSLGFEVKFDLSLLQELVGLVEWPVVLCGKFDSKFLFLPKELILFTMSSNQKYINLFDKNSKIVPYFLIVSNITSSDDGAKIISGNEKVIQARLEDAKFFWDLDIKLTHDIKLEKLSNTVFHKKLGTLADKTRRITLLTKFISVWVPHANLILAERAAMICKDDLVTEMVSEFPELQGVIGYYYALEEGEDIQVAEAISDHYKPVGARDTAPSKPLSIVVALADKIDSLVGMFLVGMKPTSSKDPYALRRLSLGIIRIILENSLSLPLRLVLEKALKGYSKYAVTISNSDDKKQSKSKFLKIRRTNFQSYKKDILSELLDFFNDRLSVLLKDAGKNQSFVNAVFSSEGINDITSSVVNIKFLEEFISLEKGISFCKIYKRVHNILSSEVSDNEKYYKISPNKELFATDEEKNLYLLVGNVSSVVTKLLKEDKFEASIEELLKLEKPLEELLDNVKVNEEQKDLRDNRLRLLYLNQRLINSVVDFSKIEI